MGNMKTRKVLMSSLVRGNRFLHKYFGPSVVLSNEGVVLTVKTAMGNRRVFSYSIDDYADVEIGCCGRCIEGVDECGEDNYVTIVVALAAESVVVFSSTNELRWRRGRIFVYDYPVPDAILEQKWVGSDGSVKWEDVPVVESAEKGNDNLEN